MIPSRCREPGILLLAYVWIHVATAELPQPLLTLKGSPQVVFRPDGKRLVGCVPGQTWRPTDVRIWELPSGKPVGLMKGHGTNIWQLSFTPDGKFLATNENWAVKIWDLETEKEIASFATPAFTRAVLFLGDGKQIVTGHDNGRVIIWDAKTQQRLKVLKGHTDWVTGLALSPDGKRLATASVDMTARVWELTTGKSIFDAARSSLVSQSRCVRSTRQALGNDE